MAAAGSSYRKSGKNRRSSNQGWPPNSGQDAEFESASSVNVFVSEHGQQSSSSGLALPQQQDQQAGTQVPPASSMIQPQSGTIQYQPTGNDPEPPTVRPLDQHQPTGDSDTPLAGADLNSDAIVDAQLTHLISRDDASQAQAAPVVPDVPMPDAPAVHDIATPRRAVGGRCRKWCISAQPASGKRKCAACSLCSIRFTHGEARLQQWGSRETTNHYVHAHCITGGLQHDHELHPKQASDQNAVDAVTRQRDTITRTAADTEVLLPIAQDADQASTAAPPDDEPDLFGREDALRMDEVIMDFQWFDQISWDSIKDLRGTTYVQPPTRFKFALQQAQHAILRAITHNDPSSPASESAWKVLILSSWLLLGRPASNATESSCAQFLDARLELFWAEDWSALWALVRAECDVAPVQNSVRRTEKQQTQSRIRKVATLARSGEKGRALAAARNAPPVPVTEQIVQEIKSLYPVDPEPPEPISDPVSALFVSEVAAHVPSTLRKMPRLSEPGPLGMRAEHWYDFGSLTGNSDLFVQVVSHIAAASVPNSVLQYLRAGQITPLAKPTGGHRPLLMMSFLRRLALKSVMSAKKESVAKCAGPFQYGVGRPDGANTMIKTIQYLAEADSSRVLVALDLKAAFQNVSRRAMLRSIARTDADLAAVFSRWYTGTTEHRMHYESVYTKITANSGVDQGCPLSACGFAAAVDPALHASMSELYNIYDSGAQLFAYLDDWYLWIKPQYILQTFAVITTATRAINLAIQATKTQVWKGSCQDPIPPEFQDKVTLTLSCLGGHLQIQGDTEPSPVVLGEQATMEKTTQRFQKIATTLAGLNAEGLNVQTVNDLLSSYVGAASQHVLRMSFVPQLEAQNFDRQVLAFWSRLMHRDITSQLFFLPLKLGGLGVGSAVQRHAAAPWRAWQSVIPSLLTITRSPDTDSLFHPTPILREQLTLLQTTISQQMNKPTFIHKPLGAALRLQTTQKKQVATIQNNIHKQLYNSLTDTPTEKAILLSQSTSHTGAHLMQPCSEAYEIEDRCFRVSVARRLMLPHPVAANPADVVQYCPNKSATGVICNKPLDLNLHHCCGCRYGGGVDRRHAALARCLADVIQSHSGVKVFIEQEVPGLTRVVNGQTERARMDLVFNLHGALTYLDVSIVAPFSCNPSLVAAASTKPGHMAKRAEKVKFERYPNINLVPFILETTGRPGSHARKFIKYLMRDADNPPIAVRDTWSTIQSVLHSAISKQQLTAAAT